MPLLDWSDYDVGYYLNGHAKYQPDMERYEFIEWAFRSANKLANPDYLSMCIRCLSAREGSKVNCPLCFTTRVLASGWSTTCESPPAVSLRR
jgi:hypothetical protein